VGSTNHRNGSCSVYDAVLSCSDHFPVITGQLVGETDGSLGVGDANEGKLLNNLTIPEFLTQARINLLICANI